MTVTTRVPRRRAGALLAALACLLPGPSALAAPYVTWESLPPLPQARTEVTAAAVAERVYVLGGFAPDPAGILAGSRRVDVYDTVAGTWSRAPDLPLPLHHTTAVALGPRIVVVGGYVGLPFIPVALSWVLDTSVGEGQAWEPFVPLPAPRGAHAAASDGESIWIFGGAQGLFTGLQSEALVLDPGAASWRRIADFPQPRDHLTGAYLEGKVYAAGGRMLNINTNTARLDVYDPETDTWTRGPDMPTPRGGIASAAAGGRMFVFGGEAPGGVTYDAAEAYDPEAAAWSVAAPMPTARHGLGAAVVAGSVHVVGGGPQPGLTYSGAHERMSPGS